MMIRSVLMNFLVVLATKTGNGRTLRAENTRCRLPNIRNLHYVH